MAHAHCYRSQLTWEGSTGVGYASYPRSHRISTPPAASDLRLSADPAFRGDATLVNPEQLLLAAVSSCQLLSFLAVAALANVDVLGYEDEAEALMPTDQRPVRITEVILRPRIRVGPETNLDQVRRLVGQAHEECYIANTMNAAITVEPLIEYAEPAA